MPAGKSQFAIIAWKPTIWSLAILLMGATGCRVVSTYQPPPPIMATPTDSTRGELVAVLPDFKSLPTAYFYGVTSNGLQGWYRPARHFLLAAEGFFWHDVSKFETPERFVKNRPPIFHYSGLANGLSGSVSVGTYGRSGAVNWVLLGGYGLEYSYVRHSFKFIYPTDGLGYYKETRRSHWGKPFLQGHAFWRILKQETGRKTNLYLMAGYRGDLLIDQGVQRQTEQPTNDAYFDFVKSSLALQPVFSSSRHLTWVHQPFLAVKVETHRWSGALRGTLTLSSNTPYLHLSPYQVESVVGWRF